MGAGEIRWWRLAGWGGISGSVVDGWAGVDAVGQPEARTMSLGHELVRHTSVELKDHHTTHYSAWRSGRVSCKSIIYVLIFPLPFPPSLHASVLVVYSLMTGLGEEAPCVGAR